eukprot:11193231-Lingulodinium_polyedra.AAC.1
MSVAEAVGRPAGTGAPYPGQARSGALAAGSAAPAFHSPPGGAPLSPSSSTPRAGRSHASSPGWGLWNSTG